MKTLRSIIAGAALLLSGASGAQVSVNVNIGSPPLWGPVGYTDVRYYYLPDVEAYYDVQTSMFIYYGGGVWIHRTYLPAQYADYDLYYGYKVVMVDYYGPTPYYNFREYRTRYQKGYRGREQRTIGVSPGRGHSGKPGGRQGKEVSKPSNGGDNNRHGRGDSKPSGHERNTQIQGNGHQQGGGSQPKRESGGGGNKSSQGGHGGRK
jgi:hypothetical protein